MSEEKEIAAGSQEAEEEPEKIDEPEPAEDSEKTEEPEKTEEAEPAEEKAAQASKPAREKKAHKSAEHNSPSRPKANKDLVKTAKTFLMNAPPGEYDDVVGSLRKCCRDPNVTECARLDTIEDWMCSQCMPVEIDGHRAVLCKEAQQSPGKYCDPHTMIVFNFDFDKRKIVNANCGTVNSSSLRAKIQEAVHKFAEHSMKNGNCGAFDDKNGAVNIVVSGSSISRENFRTGNLVMKFTYKSGHIKGAISIVAHFFENGNSYVKQESPFDEAVSGSKDDDIALDITKKLSKFYTTWVNKMSAGFDLLRDEGLNKLRRRRPIKVDPINWRREIIGVASMQVSNKK